MSNAKRRHYLVDKKLQFPWLALVAVPLVALLGALYYLIYYSVFTQILIPEALATTLLPAMKKVNIVLAICMPIALYLILLAALVYSNRVIGPVPRLERELDRILAGDHSVRIKTRQKDALKGFVEKVNLLVERLDTSRAS